VLSCDPKVLAKIRKYVIDIDEPAWPPAHLAFVFATIETRHCPKAGR